MYDWLPYWLFGVVCIAFGFWLRGLLVNAPYDPNEPEPQKPAPAPKAGVADRDSSDEAVFYAELYAALVREFDRKT